jgi:hypothetical protein
LQIGTEAWLNLFDSLIIIIPAIITILLAWRVKGSVNPLRILTGLLATFLLIHGTYHFLEFYDSAFNSDMIGFVADAFVEPLSWAMLVAFGAYYLTKAG